MCNVLLYYCVRQPSDEFYCPRFYGWLHLFDLLNVMKTMIISPTEWCQSMIYYFAFPCQADWFKTESESWPLQLFILYIYTSGVVTLFYLRIGVRFPTLLWINKLSQIFTFRNIILTFSCPWIEVTMVTMCNIQCPVFVTCDIIRLPQFVRERIVSIWVTNTGR
jgi:hypothetical protein